MQKTSYCLNHSLRLILLDRASIRVRGGGPSPTKGRGSVSKDVAVGAMALLFRWTILRCYIYLYFLN